MDSSTLLECVIGLLLDSVAWGTSRTAWADSDELDALLTGPARLRILQLARCASALERRLSAAVHLAHAVLERHRVRARFVQWRQASVADGGSTAPFTPVCVTATATTAKSSCSALTIPCPSRRARRGAQAWTSHFEASVSAFLAREIRGALCRGLAASQAGGTPGIAMPSGERRLYLLALRHVCHTAERAGRLHAEGRAAKGLSAEGHANRMLLAQLLEPDGAQLVATSGKHNPRDRDRARHRSTTNSITPYLRRLTMVAFVQICASAHRRLCLVALGAWQRLLVGRARRQKKWAMKRWCMTVTILRKVEQNRRRAYAQMRSCAKAYVRENNNRCDELDTACDTRK